MSNYLPLTFTMQLMGYITLFLDENTHINQSHERMRLAIVII
jgi:hypothetical protein